MARNWAKFTLPLAGIWFLFGAYWFFFRHGQTLGGVIFTAAGLWMLFQWLRRRR